MKKLFLSLLFMVVSVALVAQTKPSKVVLKNNDVLTGRIVEIIPDQAVKMEVYGNNIITIPYADIYYILVDGELGAPKLASGGNTSSSSSTAPAKVGGGLDRPVKDWHFTTINEVVFSLGVGKMYGVPEIEFVGAVPNDDAFGGFYTANGVGYKNWGFVGIGIGVNSHSNEPSYSVPFLLDMRARILPTKKFSPMVMVATGATYHDGSLGTFSLVDGVGVSIKFKERLQAHAIISHAYERFLPNLSVNNGILEDYWSGVYINYVGLRLGATFKF